MVGFTRGTLRIDYFWDIVGKENGANGADSYALITDNDGIRIAAPSRMNSSRRSSHSARRRNQRSLVISAWVRHAIQELNLPAVADALSSDQTEQSFQSVASPDSKTEYQFVRIKLGTCAVVVFRPQPDLDRHAGRDGSGQELAHQRRCHRRAGDPHWTDHGIAPIPTGPGLGGRPRERGAPVA